MPHYRHLPFLNANILNAPPPNVLILSFLAITLHFKRFIISLIDKNLHKDSFYATKYYCF